MDNTRFEICIVCNGEEVDVLNFPMYFELRIREHYKKGEYIWGKYLINNVIYTSKITGEVFRAQDQEKEYKKGIFYLEHEPKWEHGSPLYCQNGI